MASDPRGHRHHREAAAPAIKLESAGFVSSLCGFRTITACTTRTPSCATSSDMESMEGKRHHETRVTYDRSRNHAFYVERDLMDNKVVKEAGTDIPNCVADMMGAFTKLRSMNVGLGQSAQIPVSDGRRSANVKVTAQEREDVKTPLGVSDHPLSDRPDERRGLPAQRRGMAVAERRCAPAAGADPSAHHVSDQHRDADAREGGASMKAVIFGASVFPVSLVFGVNLLVLEICPGSRRAAGHGGSQRAVPAFHPIDGCGWRGRAGPGPRRRAGD